MNSTIFTPKVLQAADEVMPKVISLIEAHARGRLNPEERAALFAAIADGLNDSTEE